MIGLAVNSLTDSPLRSNFSPLTTAESHQIASMNGFETSNRPGALAGSTWAKYFETTVTQAAKEIIEQRDCQCFSTDPAESPGEPQAKRFSSTGVMSLDQCFEENNL
jgi:hypothetical protein